MEPCFVSVFVKLYQKNSLVFKAISFFRLLVIFPKQPRENTAIPWEKYDISKNDRTRAFENSLLNGNVTTTITTKNPENKAAHVRVNVFRILETKDLHQFRVHGTKKTNMFGRGTLW